MPVLFRRRNKACLALSAPSKKRFSLSMNSQVCPMRRQALAIFSKSTRASGLSADRAGTLGRGGMLRSFQNRWRKLVEHSPGLLGGGAQKNALVGIRPTPVISELYENFNPFARYFGALGVPGHHVCTLTGLFAHPREQRDDTWPMSR